VIAFGRGYRPLIPGTGRVSRLLGGQRDSSGPRD